MSLEDEAEALASDLGVDKQEVLEDLEKLTSYSVPLEEAKGSLRRKYGDGSASSGNEPTTKEIADIGTDDGNVTVTARVLTVGKRSIRYQGDDQTIYEGELADETGRISYTAWEEFGLSVGDTVTVGNAGVREWDGRPELNLGQSTTLVFEDDTLDVEYGVGGDRTLDALEPGDRGRNVVVRVLECERKTIDGRDGETEILSGVLGDETGKLPFTDWDPHSEIEAGASVRLENVSIREFRGVPSVNVSEFSSVIALQEDVAVSESAPELPIGDAVSSGGAYDVTLVGNVIEVRDGSGLIERCPECGRVVQNGQCRSHGAVEGEDDLRVKAILDDGTGTVTAVLGHDLTEEVYGGGIETAKEHARDAMDKEVVADEIREQIVGREYRVRGQLSVDEYGANLNATSFEESDEDPSERAKAALAEVDT
ncbi:Single-stranded DNA binding protein [Halosegnis rubeus]|jgi:replication factor A1|uniref:Single-stranded DNA binding protein n=1 Tax=Halosegnis rubeus TaxID=2212850 RepID=A0A5N5UP90_9EURY|nr:Single-stranded DNA binding protein [Halosegnis rubeus]KAB7514914.1 Single-stranded DNA binding protein [Halosegnis rubeus]KAB7518223.1 Single-stranded DNA binding protein [Halosegnis rubeus]KAB7519197.1 Single-stranded DNA binding protein [Halosegnis rubeus]